MTEPIEAYPAQQFPSDPMPEPVPQTVDDYPDLAPDEVWGIDDRVVERVIIPEWRRAVYVRGMTAIERDRYIDSLFRMEGSKRVPSTGNATARLVALTTQDRVGNRLWNQDDLKRLGQKNSAALGRITEVAQRLAGMNEQERKEIAKNSESNQSDDSGTI